MNLPPLSSRPIAYAVIFSTLPHMLRLPLWVAGLCLLFWVLALEGEKRGWPRPGQKTLSLMVGAGFLGMFATFGASLSADFWVSLLSLGAAMKLLEIRTVRDGMITVFITCFIALSCLLFSRSLFMTLYLFFCVVLAFTAMAHIQAGKRGIRPLMRVSGLIMAQALPVVLVLFLLFPRLPGGLWRGLGLNVGRTAIPGHLTPGGLSNLALNDEVAFRVRFDGAAPPRGDLYWRGLVFTRFDGMSWLRSLNRRRSRPPTGRPGHSYTVRLEPHNARWLFALDHPGAPPRGALRLADHTFRAWRPVRKQFTYRTRSLKDVNTGPLQQWELENLNLPAWGNPRARELAAQWAQEEPAFEGRVKKALDYFAEQGFAYSLTLDEEGEQSIDDFLFSTKRGFCEHYASSFAFLMRSAGVPCRVVGGYLGGRMNPYGDYMVVRHSDAHAWTEVFLPGKGWTRVDPTSVVAPARLEQALNEGLLSRDLSPWMAWFRHGPLSQWFQAAWYGLDTLNEAFSDLVIGYTHDRQRSFLEKLGIRAGAWKGPALGALLGLVLLAGLRLLWAFFPRKKKKKAHDPVQRAYARFVEKLEKAGISRPPGMGPVDFARQVSEKRQDLEPGVQAITNAYVEARYAREPDADSGAALKKLVRSFSPGPGTG